jgi:chemotaxis protein methyltransferase CheR
MDESASGADARRHVRFVGRPTTTALVFPERVHLSLPMANSVDASTTERSSPFITWIFERAGLAVESYRGASLGHRLSACLRALHASTEAQARQILEERPELLSAAVSTLLIGVTDFFRDARVFEALRTEVLPELGARGRPLRIWSAACSSGAELYSLAILLAQEGRLERSFLLGSDCRRDAMEQAHSALYNSNELRRVEPSDRQRYFDRVGTFWRPIEPLRRQVHWKVSDLGRRLEEGPWDMILWRNMAIYLKAEAAASLWRGLTSVLAPRGVLVVGQAERPPVDLPLTCVARCIYRACDEGLVSRHRPRSPSHRNPRASEASA